MANNRLYLKDTETGEQILVAKSFGDGWTWRASANELIQWLRERDMGASYGITDDQPTRLKLETENEQWATSTPRTASVPPDKAGA